MKKNKAAAALISFFLICVLFAFGESFSSGVRKGLYACSNIIIPSLFPFMVASSLAAYGDLPESVKKLISFPMKKLFKLPEECFTAVILGLIGGYPVGAKTAGALYSSGKISSSQAKRLILFCVNSGAGFAINAIGSGILSSRQSGKLIFISGCIASVITGVIASCVHSKEALTLPIHEKETSFSASVVDSVVSGATGILYVCGFVCIFSGISEIILSLNINENIKSAIICLIEVTCGCSVYAKKLSLPAISAITSFGGLCVHLQIFALSDSFQPSISLFYLFRIIHAVFSALICRILLYFFPIANEVFLTFSENAAPWSFSAPSAISLLFLSALLILDLDTEKKIC